jgi:hypothetical protein
MDARKNIRQRSGMVDSQDIPDLIHVHWEGNTVVKIQV